MTTSTSVICWPAFIQYPGDNSLEYLHDQTDWDEWRPGPSNARLIDSNGNVYLPSPRKSLRDDGQTSLPEVLSLIRAHAAQEGICCTTKIGAMNIASAIQLLHNL